MTIIDRLTITNDFLHLELVPAWGGRIARLRAVATNTDILVPLEATDFAPIDWPRGGAYPLAPYSNRIENARLSFQGRRFTLTAHPKAAPHTLHGVAHTLRWQVAEATSDQVTIWMEYDGEQWPWPFRAEQSFRLDRATLTHRMSVTNLGSTPMPAGLGFHPYFHLDRTARASFGAVDKWIIGVDYLPSGIREPIGANVVLEAAAFRELEYVGYFSGWSGRADITSNAGVVTLSAKGDLTHLVAFAPAGGRYLCLEPVSHVANGFNLSAAGCTDTGTRILQPGESFCASIDIGWQPPSK